ncbi:hypothetical protein EVA_13260 [gut metagenome]|uniref:Uncharacterized protein n=1 Tax=gut metagenome TaxID=749906 RepID=J9FUJ6_9ZZZZ
MIAEPSLNIILPSVKSPSTDMISPALIPPCVASLRITLGVAPSLSQM